MYKEKLDRLFNDIINLKDVEIHSCHIRPALEKEQLKKLFSEYVIPSEFKLFYEQMNGCQISYTFKSNSDFRKEEFGYYDKEFPAMMPNENYWHLDGCINILPVDFAFRNSWKDYIWFDNIKDQTILYQGNEIKRLVFEKQIKPIDLFSKESIAVLYPAVDHCDVLLSTDHNASYTDFEPIGFDEYIEAVIQTKGLIEKRKEIFSNSKK